MELLQNLLKEARRLKASDLHITANEFANLRIDGVLHKTKLLVTAEQVNKIVKCLINLEQQNILEAYGEIDSAYVDEVNLPYRINISKSTSHFIITIRIIANKIPDCDELFIPKSVQDFINLQQGLVLVCGATGSGKSTTLASLIEKLNGERRVHIITLEDPIEYRYINKRALIHQRAVGNDTKSFLSGLRSALRQDPDVILVGELRDKETVLAALTAAETGHLVFATLHTGDVTKAVNRIIDMFDEGTNLVRSQLAEVLQGVVCQELLVQGSGIGRVANFEVLVMNSALRSLIREGRTHQIASYLLTGKQNGMLTKEEHRKMLQEKGLI